MTIEQGFRSEEEGRAVLAEKFKNFTAKIKQTTTREPELIKGENFKKDEIGFCLIYESFKNPSWWRSGRQYVQ